MTARQLARGTGAAPFLCWVVSSSPSSSSSDGSSSRNNRSNALSTPDRSQGLPWPRARLVSRGRWRAVPGSSRNAGTASLGPSSVATAVQQEAKPPNPAFPSAFPRQRPGIGIVVPFREQLPLQSRQAQLDRFLPHMKTFFTSHDLDGLDEPSDFDFIVIVVEQSEDGRKFNRGQLLNVGFELAKESCPNLVSFITHDVDLLPSLEMRDVYTKPPPPNCAVHLASVWTKYSYTTFIGGVLGFRPEDYLQTNGYPNNYWGWGLEDDQLALRMAHCRLKTLRVRKGSFQDLDSVNMKGFLDRGVRADIQQHLPWYNLQMFQRQELSLDADWEVNGVKGLRHRIISDSGVRGCVRRVVVHLGD